MTLITIDYDVPSPVVSEAQHGLPCCDDKWWATSEDRWRQVCQRATPQQWHTVDAGV